MKIGITIPSLNVAGGVKALLKYGAGLGRRGYDVHFYWKAYSYRNYLKHRLFRPKLDWPGEDYRITPVSSWHVLPKCDVFIASSWRTATPVQESVDNYDSKGIYFIQHHEAIWDGGEEVERTYRLPLQKIVISTWLKEILQERYGQESVLLVTPVDERLFNTPLENQARRKRVLMLHHTFDWKGVDDGIAAFSRVQEQFPDLQLVVLGGREPNPALPENTEYHYKPGREELINLYAGCGIFLCPSWHEGLGMPSMEAMATGACLVTTDTGGSRDYAIPEKTALVSQPRDISGLAENLSRAIENWNDLEAIRVAGRNRIKAFSWETNLNLIEKILTERE